MLFHGSALRRYATSGNCARHRRVGLSRPIPNVSTSVGPDGMSFTARFNAATGQFTRPDGRDQTHLSEYERMKRMSQFYFDVGAWEEQLSVQGGSINGDEATKKRKRPSKRDLVSSLSS